MGSRRTHVSQQSSIVLPSRRDVLRYGGAIGALAALAGCGGNGEGNEGGGAAPDSTPSSTPSANGAPRAGGTLTVAQGVEANPAAPLNQALHNQVWRRAVYDTLLDYDPNGPSLKPCLAESWEESEDGTSLTLTLREGVVWHSGRDFEPEDVRFSIDKAVNGEPSLNLAWVFDGLQSVDIDGRNVTLSFDQPVSALYDALTLMLIMDHESYEGFIDGTELIGTGPFTWGEFNPSTHLTLERNENYYQDGRPYLDAIDLRFLTRSEALVSAVRAGDVDLGMNLLPLDRQTVGDDDFEVVAYETYGAALCAGVNVNVEPLNNKDVRQAIHYAIDRQRLNDELYLGQGKVSAAPWSPVSPVYDEGMAQAYGRGLEQARDLLAQAGAEGFSVIVEGNAPVTKACEIVAFNLGEIGLNAQVEIMEQAVAQDRFVNRSYQGVRLGFHGWNTLTPITTVRSSAPYRVENNLFNFESDEYADLVGNLASATSDGLQQASDEVTEFLIDEAFCLDLVHTTNNAVSQGALHDWVYNSWDEILWVDAWRA